MLWRTHFLAGAALGIALSSGRAPEALALSALVAGAAALLPDLDDPRSFIGRKARPVSAGLRLLAGHRGAMHSLLAALAVSAVLGSLLRGLVPGAFLLVLAGYLSHLLLDTLNPAGVPWLWPLKVRVGVPLVGVGSVFERLVLVPLLFLLCAWSYLYFSGFFGGV
ncbi:membrane-bound metal-dependent hydrolase [Ammonifex degensii KC4]|uniref:Membrane-bound metal-dependent hydrolase n=1 Tax=Ammonifex degensii (strain DSM 10501 / KC4) TaxID=429009 RepID=C9RC77_AMMDK|nr:metal-dependent hydrolase [Ammonifex degensii]ACX51854.1 membrane-bound metal-dependent hydrolase [Ammonifex degensii KC4]